MNQTTIRHSDAQQPQVFTVRLAALGGNRRTERTAATTSLAQRLPNIANYYKKLMKVLNNKYLISTPTPIHLHGNYSYDMNLSILMNYQKDAEDY